MRLTEKKTELESMATAAYRGGTLSCESGTLWLSWPNGPDILLTAGESSQLPAGRRTVVQAIRGSATARHSRRKPPLRA